MGNQTDRDSTYPNNDSNTSWNEAIDFLQLLRKDYQTARKQLEEVNATLSEREAEIDEHLRHAVFLSSNYRPLCLAPGAGTGAMSLMGNTILGDTLSAPALPKAMRLEARMLGQFELRSNIRPVEHWQSAKAKSVFQYLMTRPRLPVIKDALMETLWPECDPESASNNLKTAVYGLKKTLAGLFYNDDNFPYIIFLQGGYLINTGIEIWIDIEDFDRHWTSGRRLERQGRLDEAAREFEAAESLYRGDYLEDEPYEEWTIQRREALKDTWLAILGKLADYAIDTADYENCIIYCQKILQKDPCREDAYRRLMRCHSRLGRRNRALDWYEIGRRTIAAEFDTAPDPETKSLYDKLLRNEPI